MTSSNDKTVVDPKSADLSQHNLKHGQPNTEISSSASVSSSETVVLSNSKPRNLKSERQREISPGKILNSRFELVEKLGSGGMGTVYKARDLRQVEAGDSDPWLAVKIINAAFSQHENALTALQQETKKTQRLAHPNIVSVYDFDRDGSVAFMTMELLQGESLDKIIKANPLGLEKSQAIDIIRQITQAINYAHKLGVVHADLKPANIFLMQDGRVKVLDFGIAQAIHGETSSFDAHSLRALTPAYASINMLAGLKPEKQDDLYGLGCIFYSLLTGKHPFERRKATEADAAKIPLKQIAGLSSGQWKALKELLAFESSDEHSIQAFEYGFFKQAHSQKGRYGILLGAISILLLIGIITINWFSNQRVRDITAKLSSIEIEAVSSGINEYASLDDQDRILVLDGARDAVIQNLKQKLSGLEIAEDYRKLTNRAGLLVPLYSDSSTIQSINADFVTKRMAFQKSLENQIENRVEKSAYHLASPSFSELVQNLQLVEPKSALFTRYQIKDLLAKEVGLALYLGEDSRANRVVAEAEELFPEDKKRFHAIVSKFHERTKTASHLTLDGERSDTGLSSRLKVISKLWQQREGDDAQAFSAFVHQVKSVDEGVYNALKLSLYHYSKSEKSNSNGVKHYYSAAFPKRASSNSIAKVDVCKRYYVNRGKSTQYRCRDSLTSKHKGPELVVVKGQGNTASFAVTRAEISILDFNFYCRFYKACQSQGNTALPITNITLNEANGYARWLSKMTGKRYRLPTGNEWMLLARDDSGVKDHNCVVTSAGKVIRGNSLRPVNQGYQNSLGIVNAVGNAEEWINTQGEVFSVGGGAHHGLKNCGLQRSMKGDTNPGKFRGFRLVRQLSS